METIFIMIIYLQSVATFSQLILHEAVDSFEENTLQFDCLYYHFSKEKLAYQDLSNVVDEMIPYCFRPLNKSSGLFRKFVNTKDRNFTFEQLRTSNISSQQLLHWSSPIDLAEKYQVYLDGTDLSLAGALFYNCTKPWFGLRCEYSFESDDNMSINDIVEKQFLSKESYSESVHLPITLPCYVHIKCDRGSSSLCLDWREVCDGRIDCIDGGLDEAYCFDMESNECGDDEYRCHNGLCIPEEFWENGFGDADCLDRSDEFPDVLYSNNCFRDPTFRCEEHSCRPNWLDFSCGDGQCVQRFEKCHNGRHLLLIQSISQQGNLPYECWIAMLCLTRLTKDVHEHSCETILMDAVIFNFTEFCDSIFQFPIVPVYYNHIRFLYENISLKLNSSSLIIPDYVCYDDKLCDCIIPTYWHNNLTCIHSSIIDLASSISGYVWIDMISVVESYFRSCMNSLTVLYDKNKPVNRSVSLYKCHNSSKLISKHRIFDNNVDCCMEDDENAQLSCSVSNKHRVKCFNSSECLSSLYTVDDCPINEHEIERQPSFRSVCDGIKEIEFEDSNGIMYTDESQCSDWPCDNLYSRCDGFWTCPNGKDEENCYETSCEQGTYPCVSRWTYSLICLESKKVNDGIDDCLGGMDELRFCRSIYPSKRDPKRFRCQESDKCLSSNELCDDIRVCPLGDDETFCDGRQHICQQGLNVNRTIADDVLCRSIDTEKSSANHFSVHTASTYPQLDTESVVNVKVHVKIRHNAIVKHAHIPSLPYFWSAHCHRGLAVHIRTDDQSRYPACMCPPSYYGALCDHQNERISLTLGIVRAKRRDLYVVLIMLIENQSGRIHSYEQFEYVASQSCAVKINRYLLYLTRPKNSSKTYSIRIDTFEKRRLTYHASWHLTLYFPFLPVNRVSAILHVPYDMMSASIDCRIKCQNGQCIKYVNKDFVFCRCFSGWSGPQCDIKLDCGHCSTDSMCVETSHQRSICVCPLNKFGRQCRLISSCTEESCENGGQCIPHDIRLSMNGYTCICSDYHYGSRCQYRKAKLDVSLESLDIPPFLLAFFFTVSNSSEPQLTIMLQKLTLFQRTVTFLIALPYHIVVVKASTKLYLAAIQSTPVIDISTTVTPSQECFSVETLLNSTVLKMSRFQRLKYYHVVCQNNYGLNCFIDEIYLCFCTNEHHANCIEFNYNRSLRCSSKHTCANGAQCLQDHSTCPSAIICVCTDCFFGSQCQFYAKGLGLNLDEILGYEIKQNVPLSEQPLSVKVSACITTIMCFLGIINGSLSILTFKSRNSREVGCGVYLLASSVTSITIVILFTLKFWFLMYSFNTFSGKRILLYLNCMLVEPSLKLLLHIDNWLNGCVASERAFSVFKGIQFDKKKSRQIAKWIIACVISVNIIMIMPHVLYLRLFDDLKEERTWCVIRYSPSLYSYNSFMLFFHFFAPFLINLFSAVFIIIGTARRRSATSNEYRFTIHFKSKLKQHKHLLISPIILVLLSLPRLVISFILDCKKSSKRIWFYLSGYFISFLPSVLVCLVFILPSATYKTEFRQILLRVHRRFSSVDFNSLANKHS